MRNKQEILNKALTPNYQGTPIPQQPAKLTMLALEVLIDIRDILEQRLISLDNTILKYIIPKD